MPADDLNPAIVALERRLAEHEAKGQELRVLINLLYKEAGREPKFPDAAAAAAAGASPAMLTQIKRDTFYGKKKMTAVREYLEMRRAQGDGPATPREIYEALKAGGYRFGASTEHIALVNIRSLLRKATNVFHKLPGTGSYGLLAWYPDAARGSSKSALAEAGDGWAPVRRARRGGRARAKSRGKKDTAGAKLLPAPDAGTDEGPDEEEK